jgi:hypothetical protein
MITLDLTKVPGLHPMIAMVPSGREYEVLDTLILLDKEITALFEKDKNNEYEQATQN